MKYYNDTIGNRTRDLLTCSAVRLLNAPPAAYPKVVQHQTLLDSVLRPGGSLRVGRSGDRKPVGARIFVPVQTGHGAHPDNTDATERARRLRVILPRRLRVKRATEILVMTNKVGVQYGLICSKMCLSRISYCACSQKRTRDTGRANRRVEHHR